MSASSSLSVHAGTAEPLRVSPPEAVAYLLELYAVIRALKAGELSEEEAIERLEGARSWVWTAIDPVSKLLLAIEVGPRTVAMAQRMVHRVSQRLASGCMPAWFSDGFKGYLPAILGHCGWWVHPERRVVYPQATDNSGGSQCGTIVSFYYCERGHCYGLESIILSTPTDCCRVGLPHHVCPVARSSQSHTATAHSTQSASTPPLERTQTLHWIHPLTLV